MKYGSYSIIDKEQAEPDNRNTILVHLQIGHITVRLGTIPKNS